MAFIDIPQPRRNCDNNNVVVIVSAVWRCLRIDEFLTCDFRRTRNYLRFYSQCSLSLILTFSPFQLVHHLFVRTANITTGMLNLKSTCTPITYPLPSPPPTSSTPSFCHQIHGIFYKQNINSYIVRIVFSVHSATSNFPRKCVVSVAVCM